MNIKKKWLYLFAATTFALCTPSCSDEDEANPYENRREIPILTNVGSYTFDGLDETMTTGTYEGGKEPEFVLDGTLASNVLHLDGGYISVPNPLADRPLVEGASLTMWVKASVAENEGTLSGTSSRAADGSGALVAFMDGTQSRKLVLTERMGLVFDETVLSEGFSGLHDGEWHYFAVKITNNACTLYRDGAETGKTEIAGDICTQVFEFLSATATDMYVGFGTENRLDEFYMEDLNVYKDEIGDDEISVPEKGITVIGNTDYSSAMWESLSGVETIDGDGEFGYRFTNHSDGADFPHNYVFVVSNGKLPGEEGYVEYAVMRADWYGWTDGQEAPGHIISFEYNFNIGDFKTFMQDVEVDLRFVRQGTTGTMTANYTTTGGETYYYTCTITNLPQEGTVGTFFTVEKAYIELNVNETYAGPIRGEETDPGSIAVVGNTDYSSTAWSVYSGIETIDGDGEFEYSFTNHSDGVDYSHNYIFVVSNGKLPGEEGYSEYAALRADWYGWLNGDGLQNSVKFEYDFKIADFKTFMQDVEVNLKFVRQGTTGTMKANYTTTGGETYYYTCTITNLPQNGTVGTFFTVQNSYIELKTSKTYAGPIRQ